MERLGSSLDNTIEAVGAGRLTLRNLVVLMYQMVNMIAITLQM